MKTKKRCCEKEGIKDGTCSCCTEVEKEEEDSHEINVVLFPLKTGTETLIHEDHYVPVTCQSLSLSGTGADGKNSVCLSGPTA